MEITLNIDDNLFGKASRLTGIVEYTALIHEGLKSLIISENGKKPRCPRPIGLAKGRFRVPPDFFEELPEENRGQKMAAILEKLSEIKAFSEVADPCAWQKDIRGDRSLPERDDAD
ncbi:MAG: type II toxin-antitoxin system VapB family antitoxin [Desulfobacteraceae bacterium]|nr:type II toxin-antitoxin system VapB family antitoxin [Desulfobacteraceae bacterium]